jgi:hypothetical protein
MNFPTKFGFESDLRNCVDKTITRVELVAMEYGCTWESAYAVQFSDGSRAFFAGKPGTGIMNPLLTGKEYSRLTVETSEIFTKPEYAVMVVARQQDIAMRAREREREERHHYEELKKKFDKKAGNSK